MKKLSLILLLSYGFVSASDALPQPSKKDRVLAVLKTAGKRVVPAALGYGSAQVVNSYTGTYGLLAFLGLSVMPSLSLRKLSESEEKKDVEFEKTVWDSFVVGAVVGAVQPTVTAQVTELRK